MKKILIVDDSAFMRSILKDLLLNNPEGDKLKHPVELSEADGKANALKQVKKIKPDLILLDIVMRESEKEGVEFLEEIKNLYDTKKIIIISSIGQTAVFDSCKSYGISSYLQKPFEHNEVIQAVNKILL